MDTLSVEAFEQVVGKVLSQSVHKLMSMTGATSSAETNVKMTIVYQRLAHQMAMVEEAIMVKTLRETPTPRSKVKEMLKKVRSQAEAQGRAFMQKQAEELADTSQSSRIIVP